jgi:hypothetical protein
LVVTAAKAQQRILWQGAVIPELVNVYASTSTRDRVTTTLKQGDVVDVILEINSLGDAWCRVAFTGQSEPLGYVFCHHLEQGHFTPMQSAHNESVATQSQAQVHAISATQSPTEATAVNPAVLTNKDILDMSKTGLPPEVLVAKVKSSQCNFDTSPASLQALKTAGVGDNVILAMVQAPVGEPKPSKVADPPDVASTSNSPSTKTIPTDGKTRVLVTDSQSWEMRGGGAAGGNKRGWGGSSWMAGGARPQTAEIIKTLNERCPEITVTNNLEKADFVLTLDHEGGKSLLAHRNTVAVFNRDGDDIFSVSTRELGNSVKDACQAMLTSKK